MAKRFFCRLLFYALLISLPAIYVGKAIRQQRIDLEVIRKQIEQTDSSKDPAIALKLEMQKGFAEQRVALILLLCIIPSSIVVLAIILFYLSGAKDSLYNNERVSSLSHEDNAALRAKVSKLK